MLWALGLAGCGARTGLIVTDGTAGSAGASAGSGGAAPIVPSLQLNCPSGPADPRLPELKLGESTTLDGARFVSGNVKSWHWDLVREDCDAVVANPEFVLQGEGASLLTFQALRPAPYHFTLRVVGGGGDSGSCDFEVPTNGRGLRVELCWNTSQNTDLDLYLHNPFDRAPWFSPSASNISAGINQSTCNVVNCTANLRLNLSRADFRYADSPLSYCQAGPAAAEFQALGRCPNPRSGQDNNQSLATGVAERIQLDAPLNSQTFRVMVQNYSNSAAEPHVFVYCGGKKAGAAEPPNSPPNFVATSSSAFGVMWRAVDITTQVASSGDTTGCVISTPAAADGRIPYVTIDDPSF